MGCGLRGTVEGFAGLKTDGDLALPAEFDDFLEAGSAGSFDDKDAIERSAGAKRFADGMDSGEQGH
jgi:hypothetical protein